MDTTSIIQSALLKEQNALQMQELPTLTLSFWPIFFLIAGGQGLFFAFLVFISKGQHNSNLYLGSFLLCFGYMLIYNFCYWTNYQYQFPHVTYTNTLLNYLFGPLLLLYLDSLRPQPKLQKWAWVHFLPFFIYLIFLSPFLFQSATAKYKNFSGEIPYPMFESIRIVGQMGTFKIFALHLFFYFLWKIKLFFSLIRPSENTLYTLETQTIRKNWFRWIIILYGAFLISYFIYFFIVNQSFFRITHDYLISGIMTVSIYVIGYMGYKRPPIFSGELFKKIFQSAKKYANSTLTDSAAQSIEKALVAIMQSKKPYKNNHLKMNDLAQQLNTTPHHLSQVINEKFGKSFNQYINELRIKEAQTLLQSPDYQNTYIIQIAYEVGFNNKTTFNNAFKKVVGCSPTSFRRGLNSILE